MCFPKLLMLTDANSVSMSSPSATEEETMSDMTARLPALMSYFHLEGCRWLHNMLLTAIQKNNFLTIGVSFDADRFHLLELNL